MTSKLRIGIVGCASIAERMMIPAIKSIPELELVAIASRTREKAVEFANKANCEAIVGYENLLSRQDVDAIYMPLPTGLHLQYGTMAMERGKHLLLEKSLAANYQDALQLIKTASMNKVLLMENYMFEYHSQQERVRQLISEYCGEIRNFRASFGFPPLPAGNFRYDRSLGGGAVLDAGGYVLKAIDVLFPNAERRVISSLLHFDNKGVDLWGSAMLDVFWKEQHFAAQLAFGFDNFYQCGVEIWGSKGKLTTDRTFTAGPAVTPKAILERQGQKETIEFDQDNHFVNLLKKFISGIHKGEYEASLESIMRQASIQQEVVNYNAL